MNAAEREVFILLRQFGATLVRQRKHKIYRFADGRIFTMSSTPSNRNAGRKSLCCLRRMLRNGCVA